MRQTGIIAAAGVVALEEMLDRLTEDHDNARNLAEGIAGIHGLSIDPQGVKTNIIYVDFVSERLTADEFITRAVSRGLRFLHTGPSRFRMVTHYGIVPEDIADALEILSEVMEGG